MRLITTDDSGEWCQSVCLSVTWPRCAKTAELIAVLLGLETLADPNHVTLNGDPDPIQRGR